MSLCVERLFLINIIAGLCLEKHSTRVAVAQVEEVRALINVAAGSRVTLRSTHPTRCAMIHINFNIVNIISLTE